jgi:hypothetical protein
MHHYSVLRSGLAVAACALVVTAGCASRGAPPHGDHDLLTSEQLGAFSHLNAYDAIRQTRPQWLRNTRGQSSILRSSADRRGLRIYVDGILFGGALDLRSLEVRAISEVRFLDARQATLLYGTNHAEGALMVKTIG